MNSSITEDFLACFARLPEQIQRRARRIYRVWKQNPSHPSLHFKQVHGSEPVFSVRIGRDWRALGLRESDTVTWFWIGSHAEYDRLVDRL